ncbi:MAG: phosphoribosylamine--glycine ligase [Actinobacteria bacterium]|nr:phosphoribosylamine--glycine ligase [Actinomycetota bacterium]
MKILLLGSGGREHAIARALVADPAVDGLVVAPGNPGTARIARNVTVDITDPAAVAGLALAETVDLVVVGPEAPLVAGVADAVRAAGIHVFGPSAAAARLEGSKAFAKEIMAAAGVPTAMARVCTTLDEVRDALESFGTPHVVKDDGLAAGKGVIVTDDFAEALAHADRCLDRPAEPRVVVEDHLDGPEVSLFCLCDGEDVVALAPAQDFKRALDGGQGPNTGGMGAYSPLPWAEPGLTEEVLERVARPVVREMAARGTPFVGVLYCGLALTSRGLRVVEFNVRFGDPETQVVLARLQTPLAGLLDAAARGALATAEEPRWSHGAAVTVVLASEGYPGPVSDGREISGVAEAESLDGVHVIHAGTRMDDDGRLVSAGGRVLCVVGEGDDVAQARDRAYRGVAAIHCEGAHYRHDIASGIGESGGRP